MYKKTVKFKNYITGEDMEEDFYFNLNQSEITKWLTTSGNYTLDALLQRLYKERDGKKIMEIFEGLIKAAYGERSLDGRLFLKTDDVWDRFFYSDAYNVIFNEIVTDAGKAAEFINSIIPEELAQEVAKAMADNPEGIPSEIRDYVPSQKVTPVANTPYQNAATGPVPIHYGVDVGQVSPNSYA